MIINSKRLFILTLLIFIFGTFYLAIFNTTLYADGACYFIWDYLWERGKFHNFQRASALLLQHIPFYFLKIFEINYFQINFILWKIGFIIPFFISLFCSIFLNKSYRNLYLLLIILSYIIFYLPNSMFAIGEYYILFSFGPLFLVSLKEFIEKRTDSSFALLILSSLIVSFSYEMNMFATFLALSLTILFLFIENFFIKKQKISILKLKLFFVDNLSLIIVTIFIFLAGLYILKVLQGNPIMTRNGARAIREYLYQPVRGGFSDTLIYFMLFFSLTINSFFKISKQKSYSNTNKIFLNFLLIFLFFIGIFSNHLPVHSYYSKALYIPIFFVLLIVIYFTKIEDVLKYILFFKTFLIAAIIISISFSIKQGLGFNKYLGLVENELNDLNYKEFKIINENHFKKNKIGYLYDWSWNHECLSRIINPENKSVIKIKNKIKYPNQKKVISPNFDLRNFHNNQ